MKKKIINNIFISLFILVFTNFLNAQDLRVIDNKGTLRNINKVRYSGTSTTPPTATNPTNNVKGDIYIIGTALNPQKTYLFDGTNWVLISSSKQNVVNKTSDYTLTLNDNSNTLTFNSTTDITLTIPTGLPVGFNVLIYQIGTGKVIIKGATDTTVLNRLSRFKTAGKDAGAGILSTGSNIFHLTGDLKR